MGWKKNTILMKINPTKVRGSVRDSAAASNVGTLAERLQTQPSASVIF
jgi:hypothetical protein